MPNSAIRLLLLLLFTGIHFSFKTQSGFNKIQLDLTMRKVIKGKKVVLTGTVYCEKAGRMTTHIKSPEEIVILNNTKGDYTLYMPRTNEILQENDYNLSSETNTLYYFLFSNSNHTGLKDIGFTLSNTQYKGEYMITLWQPPAEMSSMIKEAELVYKNNVPVYLKYVNTKGKTTRKTYFYDYQKINYVNIPFSISEIAYFADGDSSVEKTTFSNVKINNQVDENMLSYKIPASAKLVKP
ncbi:MAG: hypothetical protein ACK4K9_05390 [Bacteroidia bacterium]